jgi:hypothetical protein
MDAVHIVQWLFMDLWGDALLSPSSCDKVQNMAPHTGLLDTACSETLFVLSLFLSCKCTRCTRSIGVVHTAAMVCAPGSVALLGEGMVGSLPALVGVAALRQAHRSGREGPLPNLSGTLCGYV